MNDMTTFEALIADVTTEASGPSRPVSVAEIMRTATTTTVRWRFPSMLSATKFVVAAMIVALFGGFLLSGVLTTQPGPQTVPGVGAPVSASDEPTLAATNDGVSPAASERTTTTEATLLVAKDGSGDYLTIAAAVNAANDGDTVLIRPGIYEEQVTIERDITLRGDGDRADVVITATQQTDECQGPYGQRFQCVLWLRDAVVTVTNLTLGEADDPFRDPPRQPFSSLGWVMIWMGGTPTLEGTIVTGSVRGEGSGANFRDNVVSGAIIADGGNITVEGNEVGFISVGAPPSSVDSRSFVRRNHAGAMRIGGSVAVVEGNDVVAMEPDAEAKGIDIRTRSGADLVVRGNDIRGFNIGIRVSVSNEAREAATTRIVENTIIDNRVGIRLFKVGDAVIGKNTFCDNEINVDVRRGPGLKVKDSCAAVR